MYFFFFFFISSFLSNFNPFSFIRSSLYFTFLFFFSSFWNRFLSFSFKVLYSKIIDLSFITSLFLLSPLVPPYFPNSLMPFNLNYSFSPPSVSYFPLSFYHFHLASNLPTFICQFLLNIFPFSPFSLYIARVSHHWTRGFLVKGYTKYLSLFTLGCLFKWQISQ